MSIHVSSDNFVRAETDRMMHDLIRDAGGVNVFSHNREPAPIHRQTVIRLNRDTLYSFAVVDVSRGATLTLPDAGGRYLSAMVVNADHVIDAVYHDAGSYRLTEQEFGSPHVIVAVRILVDPRDTDDLAAVAALQDAIGLTADSAAEFVQPDYDTASQDATRRALLGLAAQLTSFTRMFGTADEVDPVRHLIGTAAGWGGLPTSEATYVAVTPGVDPGLYELVLADVPVDAFWSISVYDATGYFVPNADEAYTVNSVTAEREPDGSVIVRLGDWPAGTANAIPTPEGWNYLLRLYRPQPAALDGSWSIPDLRPSDATQPVPVAAEG